MKRLFAILLALMLVIGMVGCGQDATTPTETTAPTVETTVPPTEPVSTDIPVVVTEQYAVYVVGTPTNEPTYGTSIVIRFENLSPKSLTFKTDLYTLNGEFEMTTTTTTSVGVGHKEFIDVTFFASDLALAKIETITSVEFVLDIWETDEPSNYLNSDSAPHVITFQ